MTPSTVSRGWRQTTTLAYPICLRLVIDYGRRVVETYDDTCGHTRAERAGLSSDFLFCNSLPSGSLRTDQNRIGKFIPPGTPNVVYLVDSVVSQERGAARKDLNEEVPDVAHGGSAHDDNLHAEGPRRLVIAVPQP
jgi:hypothetical protein